MKRAIERFNLAFLPRAAFGDEQRFDISFFQPTANYLRYELRAIVAANVFGGAAYGEQVLQHTHHILSGKRTPYLYRQAFSRVLVDHYQQPKLTTILGPICHKVVRPHMVLVSGTMTHATIFTFARESSLTVLFSRDLHMLSLPNSMDTFLVYHPASLRQQPIKASRSETWTLTSQ